MVHYPGKLVYLPYSVLRTLYGRYHKCQAHGDKAKQKCTTWKNRVVQTHIHLIVLCPKDTIQLKKNNFKGYLKFSYGFGLKNKREPLKINNNLRAVQNKGVEIFCFLNYSVLRTL